MADPKFALWRGSYPFFLQPPFFFFYPFFPLLLPPPLLFFHRVPGLGGLDPLSPNAGSAPIYSGSYC